MKTSTNVNQGKKQNVCVAFCLNNHLVTYVKSTDYIVHTDLEKIGSTNETHQQIALDIGTPLGSKALLTTALKLEVLAVRRHTAKNGFPYHVFLSQLTRLLINLPHNN